MEVTDMEMVNQESSEVKIAVCLTNRGSCSAR